MSARQPVDNSRLGASRKGVYRGVHVHPSLWKRNTNPTSAIALTCIDRSETRLAREAIPSAGVYMYTCTPLSVFLVHPIHNPQALAGVDPSGVAIRA